MLILFIVRKGILSTISGFTSANRKFSSKNSFFPILFNLGKGGNYYFVSLQSSAVNFLDFNINLLDFEAWLESKSLAHCIDFAF